MSVFVIQAINCLHHDKTHEASSPGVCKCRPCKTISDKHSRSLGQAKQEDQSEGHTSMQERAASRWALERLHRVFPSNCSSTSRPGLLSGSTPAPASAGAFPLPFLSCCHKHPYEVAVAGSSGRKAPFTTAALGYIDRRRLDNTYTTSHPNERKVNRKREEMIMKMIMKMMEKKIPQEALDACTSKLRQSGHG